MDRIRVSACSANYGHADLFRVMDRLAELGFDGIEITAMYHAVPAETPATRRQEIRRHAVDCGLAISALHFIFEGGMRMGSEDPAERERVANHMISVFQLAADLEAPVVVIGGGGVRAIPDDVDWEEGLARVLGVYETVARRIEGLGVIAGFEALNRYEANMGHTLDECRAYAERIGGPMMKVVGDTFHMNIEEASLPAAIERAGPQLAHLHLVDSHRLAPGGGHIDFAPIFNALQSIIYTGYVSFEFFWITPRLAHLSTFQACDAEVANGLKYLRGLGLV